MFVCGVFSRVVVRYRTQYNYALSLEKSILKKKMLISIRFIIQAHLFNKFNNIHTQKYCVSMTETT